jgi:cation transport ATPase
MFKVSGFSIAFNPHDDITRETADVVVEGDDLRGIMEHILEE